MSSGRSHTAAKYHEPLLKVIDARPKEFADEIKSERIRELYTEVTGDKDEKRFFLPSDHCDRLEGKEGVCPTCKSGQNLLQRVRHGYYRATSKILNRQPIVAAAQLYKEGRRLLRQHRIIERNLELIAEKKARVLQQNKKLACEVCKFDFAEVYGTLCEGFAECHHTTPMAQTEGVRISRLEDLAIVCANCHRALHRQPFHTVDELRILVKLRGQSRWEKKG